MRLIRIQLKNRGRRASWYVFWAVGGIRDAFRCFKKSRISISFSRNKNFARPGVALRQFPGESFSIAAKGDPFSSRRGLK
jgi:hypothetical protein